MENTGEKFNLPDKTELEAPLCFRRVRRKVDRYLGNTKGKEVQPYEFGPKHLKWLETFTNTLDYKEASRESGLSYAQVQKSEYMLNEIQLIMEAASYKNRVRSAMGNHQRLMAKFEKDYDRYSDGKIKTGLASTLAKMSEANLKSQGEFKDDKDAGGPKNLQLIFNFGGARADRPPEAVDVTVEQKE